MGAVVRSLAILAALAAAGDPVKTSAHYEWSVHGECPEVPELMRVAEALWSQLSAYFGARPSGKLRVDYYAKADDYSYALTHKGAAVDGSIGPNGMFLLQEEAVHQPRMARPWDTRQALIVNLVDQFLLLGVKAKGKPIPTWYRAGLMCHFSLHRWDGKTLVTGVDDEPGPWGRSIAKYAGDAKEGKWDPMDAVNGDAKIYIEAWTAVHFLLSGADRGATAKFKSLERKMWEGMEARDSTTALLGGADARRIRKAAADWIVALPRPWNPIRDSWERTSEDGFLGEPFHAGTDAQLVRDVDAGAAPFAEAVIAPEGRAVGGVFLGWAESSPVLAALWTPGGKVRLVLKSNADSGLELASADGPAGTEARLRIEAAAGGVRVLVAGKEVLAWKPGDAATPWAGRTGLFAYEGKVRFTGVKVSEPPAPKK